MKVFRVVVAGVIAMIVAAPAFAQRIEVQPIKLQPGIGLQANAPLLASEALEKLKFTAEQKEKYTKIDADYKEKAKSIQDAFKTATMAVRDREKYKEALDKMQTDSKKAREDGLGKVEPILTAEQKTVFAQVKQIQPQPGGVRPLPIGGVGGGIGQVLPPGMQQRLQLTDEQKKQIEAIQKEAEAKVLKVLTDEQKKQLEQIKKGPVIRPIQIQPVRPIQVLPRVPKVRPVDPANKE